MEDLREGWRDGDEEGGGEQIRVGVDERLRRKEGRKLDRGTR